MGDLMAARIAREPSPTRTGLVHGGLCMLTLAGLVQRNNDRRLGN